MTKSEIKQWRCEKRSKSIKTFLKESAQIFWGGLMFSLAMWIIFGPFTIALNALVGQK
jgi:hypothetical protein